MSSGISTHSRDHMPPLTDEELRIIGTPSSIPRFGKTDCRTGYYRHSGRVNDAIHLEMHAMDEMRLLGAREEQRVLNAALARVDRMIPSREEYLKRPGMYCSEEESEDDEWIEEWNRGMRKIEQEIEAGEFEIVKSTNAPPRRNVCPTMRRMSSETDVRMIPTKFPSRHYQKKMLPKSKSPVTKTNVTTNAPSRTLRPRGRPRKVDKADIPRSSGKQTEFRKANRRRCALEGETRRRSQSSFPTSL